MREHYWYAVVEFNQASGCPEDNASVWDELSDALDFRDQLTAETRRNGRREEYRVYRLVEIEDADEYEWAVRHVFVGAGPDDGQVMQYVNEHAARVSAHGDDVLLRRRAGKAEWAEVAR